MLYSYFSKKDWIFVALIVVLIFIQVYLDLEIPGYMQGITLSLEKHDDSQVLSSGITMLAFAFASIACALMNDILGSKVATEVAARLRRLEFENVLRYSKKDIDSFSAASLITRSTNDVYQIQQFIGRGLHIVIMAPILAVGAILKIAGTEWQWTAATAAAIAVLVFVMGFSTWYMFNRFKKIQFLMDGLNRASRENIEGIRTVRAYNAEEHQAGKFDNANSAMLDNDIQITKVMAFMFPVTSSITNFLTMGIYWIGMMLISNSSGDVNRQMELYSDMIVFSSYAMQMISAFLMFTGIFRMVPRAMVSSRRICEVIEHVPSVPDDSNEAVVDNTIEFRHVTFSYPGIEAHALEDISFKASPGETVAVIGPTGSGKTTLVNMIMRFYDPDEGVISIGGTDIRNCSQKAYRGCIGYVPQNAIIFDGSVRENVNYGEGSDTRTDDDVIEALKTAQAYDFVMEMPEKLDSHISQHGRNLSGGQKQRICIARAVCRKPGIYVLDDCFSALDYMTDLEVRKALSQESGNTIRFIVAQRIGTIMDADRILVMDHGRIVGSGTHSELLRDCPLYKEIAESQVTGDGQ